MLILSRQLPALNFMVEMGVLKEGCCVYHVLTCHNSRDLDLIEANGHINRASFTTCDPGPECVYLFKCYLNGA